MFWGTAVTIRRRSFFSIGIVPFSPPFASWFCFKLCIIFVFDCWKVRAVLLCVLVDVFIGSFSIYMGVFCTKKWGATKKLFSLKIALHFDAVASHIQQSTRIGSADGTWRVFWYSFVSRPSQSVVGPHFLVQIIPFSPFLPLCFISYFPEYLCLIGGRCVECCYAFLLWIWLSWYDGFAFDRHGLSSCLSLAKVLRLIVVLAIWLLDSWRKCPLKYTRDVGGVWLSFAFCETTCLTACFCHLVAFSCGNWPPKQQQRQEQEQQQQLDHYSSMHEGE